MSRSAVQAPPLTISQVPVSPFDGVIGITLCPGHSGRKDLIDRDLKTDLAAILDWGANAIVTLMENDEFSAISVPELPQAMTALGIKWYHMPICDTQIPDEAFEYQWAGAGQELKERLKKGEKLLIHCRGGLGRSGTIAARLLIELGHLPNQAIAIVRVNRPGAIENSMQENYVHSLGK